MNVFNRCASLRAKPCDRQCRSCSEVMGANRRTLKPVDTVDNGYFIMHAYVCSHSVQLCGVAKTVFKNVFNKIRKD